MTLANLIANCENIGPKMEIMLYDSDEDFTHATCNWQVYPATNLAHSNAKIGKFRVYDNFIAVALA